MCSNTHVNNERIQSRISRRVVQTVSFAAVQLLFFLFVHCYEWVVVFTAYCLCSCFSSVSILRAIDEYLMFVGNCGHSQPKRTQYHIAAINSVHFFFTYNFHEFSDFGCIFIDLRPVGANVLSTVSVSSSITCAIFFLVMNLIECS